MDRDKSAQFVSSLLKFIQNLIQDCIYFETSVIVKGNLVLTVDDCRDVEFSLNDDIHKSKENQLFFPSKSSSYPSSNSGEEKDLFTVTSSTDAVVVNLSQLSCFTKNELEKEINSSSIQTTCTFNKNIGKKDPIIKQEELNEGQTCDDGEELQNYDADVGKYCFIADIRLLLDHRLAEGY